MRAFMYTPGYSRRGILPVITGKALLRNNDVSTFMLDVDGADPKTQLLQHDWRIVIEDEGVQLLPGTINRLSQSSKSGVRDVSVSGVDDMAWLKHMITLPTPSRSPDQQDQDAYYKASGPAAKLISDLVRVHIGQDAQAAYKRPLTVLTPGPGFAKQVSINSRFKTVLEEVQTLSTGLNMRMTQDDRGQQSAMRVSKGRDFSRSVKLTEINGGLTDWDMSQDAPTVTDVLVAGQGEGAARTLKLVPGNANDWGFKSLQFQDRRDTNDIEQLIQAGEETLAEGREKAAITLEIGETPDLRFGRDFWLGDTITVQLAGGAVVTDVVQVADISWNAQGRTVKLTIGPVLDEQDAPRWVAVVRQLQAQIKALEAR